MPPTQSEKGAHFQQMHARPGAFVIPNPWDAGSARLLTSLGFDALTTTSAGLAFSLGRRDGLGLVSRAETLANAKAIVDATDLPVAADLENGFGDRPEDVARTIREARDLAGLVGGSIEDATGDPRRPIYDLNEAVERVHAAVEAAHKPGISFTLVARAENFLHGRRDLDDTIRRLQAFEAAGADVLYAPGLRHLDDVRRVCGAVTKPVNVLVGVTSADGALATVAELADAGARRISLGSTLTRAALGGFLRAAREIREAGSFTFVAAAMPFAEISDQMSATR
jgi:2-methylisocitrate lyase-like PEP mutase family enzyme